MSLFDVKAIKEDEIEEQYGSAVDYSKVELLRLTYETKQRHTLHQCFEGYNEDRVIKFFTDGAWSMHQLVQYFLEQIGPSVVHINKQIDDE